MELLLYWHIIKKRLWIVTTLLIAFLLSYIVTTPRPVPAYSASMRFVMGLTPEADAGEYYRYDLYYTWLTAEYLLDDFAEVVKSHVFAQDVAMEAGVHVPAGAIQGATQAGKLHRILSIQVTWPNRDELQRIADALARLLQDESDRYFAQLSTDSAVVSMIDPPTISLVGPSLRQRLDLPLRTILALVAGIGLAFLLDYLDDTIRGRTDIEALGLPILAEIPQARRWMGPFRRRRSSP